MISVVRPSRATLGWGVTMHLAAILDFVVRVDEVPLTWMFQLKLTTGNSEIPIFQFRWNAPLVRPSGINRETMMACEKLGISISKRMKIQIKGLTLSLPWYIQDNALQGVCYQELMADREARGVIIHRT